jgi:dUTPase
VALPPVGAALTVGQAVPERVAAELPSGYAAFSPPGSGAALRRGVSARSRSPRREE